MRAIGLDHTTFQLDSIQFVSQDPANPTLFEAEKTCKVEKGSKVFPVVGDPSIAQMDIMMDVYFASLLHKSKEGFTGDYVAFAEYRMEIPLFGGVTLSMDLSGTCEIRTSS